MKIDASPVLGAGSATAGPEDLSQFLNDAVTPGDEQVATDRFEAITDPPETSSPENLPPR